MSADAPAAVWGGLAVAGMPLALPLAALREVVPLAPLVPLPSAAPAVAGTLAVRGVGVPVIDLGRLFGRRPAAEGATCVVLVVHEGRLCGLLAEAVTGVFLPAPGSFAASGGSGGDASAGHAFAGSLRRADSGALVQALALDRLAALPALPWIDDPEPARQRVAEGRDDTIAAPPDAATRRTLLVVRCGPLTLGVDALAVHGTLWEPRLAPSVLAHGACRGTVAFDGLRVPAVDTLAVCGLGRLDASRPLQALLLREGDGLVALLVDQVLEIVQVEPAQVVPMPAGGPAQAGVFAGLLAGGARAADTAQRPQADRRDALVLDTDVLRALPELQALARANAPLEPGAARRRAAGGDDAEGDATARPWLVTLGLPHEAAVPMAQLREILPCGTPDAMFGPEAPLRGVQVHDGRSLPVWCLARLLGGTVERVAPGAAVLVVEVDGARVGFEVPALRAIERASWQRTLPGPRPVVGIGDAAGTRRTLALVDLHAIAHGLIARRDATAPSTAARPSAPAMRPGAGAAAHRACA